MPGKIAGLFDGRLHQWRDFLFLPDPFVNEKVNAHHLVCSLPKGTLLLFDRGDFSSHWFDSLPTKGYWWVSRCRADVRLFHIHAFYQQGSTFDGVVGMGQSATQAACAVRFIRFVLDGQEYRYVTNVLDPLQLSLTHVVQLYRRRWDREKHFGFSKTIWAYG